jgi:hypothetical protein
MEPDIKPERVEFDTTLDEIVDTQLRATRLTKAGRSWRRRAVVGAGVSAGVLFTGVVFLALSIRADAARVTDFAIAAVGGLVIGSGWGRTYGRIYDWWVRRRTGRFIAEWLGGKGPFRCEIELRLRGPWVRMASVETAYTWTDATYVEDKPDSIEVRFLAGLIVVRNRVFQTPFSRQRFLQEVRRLAAR